MKKQIYPCLWFDGQAKEAATFYCNLFENDKIIDDNPLVCRWEINGMVFMGLNGGPKFKFTEAVSFVVECESQAEIDKYWNTLTSDGGEESNCGWCRDKYGLSWQIVPSILPKLMGNPDKREAVTNAFLKMKKFDIQTLLNC
ncbi:MAG TPA: VOC family protein [Saprospiraceae bacterium]|nr:VOC family protein [Saprospiraceae bacterium]